MAESIDDQISYYEILLSEQDYANATRPAKGKAVSVKTAAGAVEQNTLKRFNAKQNEKDVLAEIEGLSQYLQHPPRHFKPAFLLTQLTPKINVRILLQQGNETVKIDLFEQEMNGGSVFDSTPKPLHNHIKSFKYTVTGEGAGKGVLEVVDVDASIAEVLILRFVTLGTAASGLSAMNAGQASSKNILLEIEYGWYVPASIEAQYKKQFGNSASVSFSNSQLCTCQSPKLKYNMNGTIDITFELTMDLGFAAPFIWWRPYEVLGNNPAFNIVLIQFIQTLVDTWIKYCGLDYNEKTDNANKKISNFLGKITSWMYVEFFHSEGKLKDIKEIISAMLAIFAPGKLQVVNNVVTVKLFNAAKFEMNKANKLRKKTQATKPTQISTLSTPIEKLYASWVEEASIGKVLSNVIGEKATGNKALGANGIQKSDSNIAAKYASITSESIKKLNTIIPVLNSKDSFGAKGLTGYNEIVKESKNSDDDKKKEIALRIVNFIEKITPVLLDSWIHPLIVELYVVDAFSKGMQNETKKSDDNVKKITMDLIYPEMIQPYKIEPTDGTPYGSFYQKVIVEQKNVHVFSTRTQKERWQKPVREFNIDSGSSWMSLIGNCIASQRVVNIVDKESSDTLLKYNKDTSVKEISLSKRDDVKEKYYVPLSCAFNHFTTNKNGALQNIRQMIRLMEQRMATQKQDIEDIKSRGDMNILTVLRDLWAKIESQQSEAKKYVFMFKDILPSSTLYNDSLGKTTILQAYSFRANGPAGFGGATTEWNPGWPIVWDVNFPDIISFEPDLDFYSLFQSMGINAKPMQIKEGTIILKDELTELLETVKAKADIVRTAKSSVKGQIKTDKDVATEELRTAINNLKNLNEKFKAQSNTNGNNPVGFNMNFKSNSINNGSVPEVLAAKRNLQEFRKKLMMQGFAITAKLRVIGDPSFKSIDAGGSIFLKVTNQDGSLSLFTGLYIVNRCEQEISAGKFETSFDLTYNSTNGDFRKTLEDAMYNTDHMVMSKR